MQKYKHALSPFGVFIIFSEAVMWDEQDHSYEKKSKKYKYDDESKT